LRTRWKTWRSTTLLHFEELEKIQGVSKGKALRYGRKFVDLIAKYVEENDIVKPDDFVMKSVVNKSGMKVFIIQNIDKKIPLETIAKNKGLSLQDLLVEMETIVASGTKAESRLHAWNRSWTTTNRKISSTTSATAMTTIWKAPTKSSKTAT
jgi:hypothetical protein